MVNIRIERIWRIYLKYVFAIYAVLITALSVVTIILRWMFHEKLDVKYLYHPAKVRLEEVFFHIVVFFSSHKIVYYFLVYHGINKRCWDILVKICSSLPAVKLSSLQWLKFRCYSFRYVGITKHFQKCSKSQH